MNWLLPLRLHPRSGASRPRHWRELWCDQGGQALVEAAILLPILAGLFLGVSEFSEAFTVNRRLEAAANASSDLVARVQSVTTADLTGIKAMIDEMMRPYPTAPLGIVITSVVTDGNNVPQVDWSYAQGAGVSPRAKGSVPALPAGITEPNSSIVVGEVSYEFRSTLSRMIGNFPMHTEAYFRPRASWKVEKLD